jgi:hypothetical protein
MMMMMIMMVVVVVVEPLCTICLHLVLGYVFMAG